MPAMILFTTLLFIGAAADNQGWLKVKREKETEFDLENIPLEIKTNSTIGSGETVTVYFYHSQGHMIGVFRLKFSSPPQYMLSHCTGSWTNFKTSLPTATDKVWRISKTRTSGIRQVIHCNNVELLNFLLSDCFWRRDDWNWKVAKIKFSSYAYPDTASKYYRPMTGNCTGLKAEWKSTMETTTQFPVAPGTVVEVTCSESGALNIGSSAITCVVGTGFSYTAEPSCPKKGWYAVPDPAINFDLENIPLEIKTNSTTGSEDEVLVVLYDYQLSPMGRVHISFNSTPQYQLLSCIPSWNNFTTNPPTATEKVWRMKLDRTSGIRLQIHCNEVEVLNFLVSDSTCSNRNWKFYWRDKVTKIGFSPQDTASDYYRGNCTGLKAEWKSTTTTQFPVLTGTVVEVTCSESGDTNNGSSVVTCVMGTVFSYTTEPSCSKPESNNTVAIVVPVVIVVLLAGIAAAGFFVYKRKRKSVNETVHMSKEKNVDSHETTG